ncbi:uncharacterized protein LOC119732931 [Patiria miniata]|uniref:Uncharacterized protein n=1 Tax=Patiria miniata TaxID=46514 RepID=A0A914AFE0_PATMI|nr:uncharacterized protein LOC119732931 [Patiria miniata]
MPSIDAKVEERKILDQRATNGVDLSKFAKQVGTTNPATMPCSPYDKCSPNIQESVPPGYCISPPSKSNGMMYTKSMPIGPIMAPVESRAEKLESSQKMSEPEKDTQAGKGETERQKQEKTASKSKQPKPRSFSLLEMRYNKDQKGKGHGRLVQQRSVKNSYEKEMHKLSHAVSAPAAISDDMEPPVEDEVFTEEKKTDGEKQQGDDITNVPSDDGGLEIAPERDEKQSLEARGHDEPKEETKTDKAEESSPGNKDEKVELIRDEEKTTKESTENPESSVTEKTDSGEKEKTRKIEAEKVTEDENEKPKMEKTASDIEALTQDLQTTLHLEDSGDKEKKDDEIESKEKEVSSLADDLQQSLSLQEKGEKKAVIKEEGGRIRSSERERPRLRSRGIQKQGVYRPDVNMPTDNFFTQQGMPSQQTSASINWPMGSQQQQSLPPVQCFLQPQMGPSDQSSQSFVCPPGQSNNMRMVYVGPSGQQMYRYGGQSMQTQHAQNIYIGNAAQQPQPGYQQNFLHSGGPTAPFIPPQRMNIPGESTGTPSEVDWPPTPESSVDDILDIIESDAESVRSPVESEEPMTGTLMDMIGVASPQSSWDESHAPSISSISPVPSPYASDHQQSSPAQLVPDLNGPWSPDSNVSSHGEPLSPSGSTIIKVTGHMSLGTVTISPMSPHSPCKRQRNDSSTESREAQERISDIKNFLREKPHTSPPYLANWPSPPQVQPYSAALTPPYTPAAASHAPTQPFQTQYDRVPAPQAPIYAQPHAPRGYQQPPTPPGYQQPPTPPEGELEAFRKHLAGWSVEELLCPDEDLDTVLHLAICQAKISLSLAIIERICKHKQCLNVVNKLQQTPLYLSVVSKLPDLTQILINYGADLFIGNKQGDTPLHAAAKNGNNDAIKAICEGINCCGYSEEVARELFDLTNYAGKTALMLAVEHHGTMISEGDIIKIINCNDTVRNLLQSFASALQSDSKSGKTALHYAVELHKIDLIYILLDYCDDPGSLVNKQMYDGNTALHLIVGRNRPEHEIINIVNLLMTRGANVGLENAAREKPLDLVHREHLEIKRRLHGQGNRKR